MIFILTKYLINVKKAKELSIESLGPQLFDKLFDKSCFKDPSTNNTEFADASITADFDPPTNDNVKLTKFTDLSMTDADAVAPKTISDGQTTDSYAQTTNVDVRTTDAGAPITKADDSKVKNDALHLSSDETDSDEMQFLNNHLLKKKIVKKPEILIKPITKVEVNCLFGILFF